MGLRAINNPNSSFEDPYANTGTEASIEWQPPKWYGDRGCFGGGYTGSDQNVIGYVTISSTGDASDFGDLTQARQYITGASNNTRGLWMGGGNASGTPYAITDYITIGTLGNATDFGDPTVDRAGGGGCSDGTYAIMGGGYDSSAWPTNGTNTIDYYTISTTGNATDFGDLTEVLQGVCGVNDATRGLFGGGNNNSDTRQNIIQYITMATTGNATDFGDLTQTRSGPGSCSGD